MTLDNNTNLLRQRFSKYIIRYYILLNYTIIALHTCSAVDVCLYVMILIEMRKSIRMCLQELTNLH